MCTIVFDVYHRPVFLESLLGFGASSGEFRDGVFICFQAPVSLLARRLPPSSRPWGPLPPTACLEKCAGAPRNPAPTKPLLGVDCQTIRLPLHRWALDKHNFHRGSTNIVECRPPLGALPLSLRPGWRRGARRRCRGPRARGSGGSTGGRRPVSCDIPTHTPAQKSSTNFLPYVCVIQVCSTKWLGHGHGYEWHSSAWSLPCRLD